jgi:hypothetical protein
VPHFIREDAMNKRSLVLLGVFVSLLSSQVLAQSGQIACEQDLRQIEQLFNEKQAALTPTERQDAMVLLDKAKNRCASEGSSALNTRSQEASMLLEKLQNAPSPSQAAVPQK